MVFGFLFNMKPKRRANISVDEKDRRSFWITAQKMKSPIKDFFSKCDQIRRKLRIWSHLLKKSLMEDFIFCAVTLFTGAVLSQLTNIKIAIFLIIHLSFQKSKN